MEDHSSMVEYIPFNGDRMKNGTTGDAGILAKAVILGNAGIGKRTLALRLKAATSVRQSRILPTDSTDDRSITSGGYTIPNDIKLQIWEASEWGRGVPHPLPLAYARGATVWLLCFEHRPTLDLSDKASIDAHCQDAVSQLQPWFQYLTDGVAPFPVLPILVGLKSDLVQQGHSLDSSSSTTTLRLTSGFVGFNQAICRLASSEICSAAGIPELLHPLRCFHVSAKTNEGVAELLQYSNGSMRDIVQRFPRGIPEAVVSSSALHPRGVQ